MSPSIPNNVIPLIPSVSETLPESDSSPGFDQQLRRQVAKTHAKPSAADRTEVSNRDDQVASNSSDADREEVNHSAEVGESEIHEAPTADPPSEEETQDTVEVSESGQTEADAQQTIIEGEVVENTELIVSETQQSDAAPAAVVVPNDELANATIEQTTGDGEETPSLLNSDEASSGTPTEHENDSPTAARSKLVETESALAAAEIAVDSAPSSEAPLTEATKVEQPPAGAQVAGSTNTKEVSERALQEAAGSSARELAEAVPIANDTSANSEGESRERRRPQSSISQLQRPVEKAESAQPVQALLQETEPTAIAPSNATGDTDAAALEKQAPAFHTPASSTNPLQRQTIEQAGASTTQENPQSNGPRVDAGRFVNRVARAFQAAEQRGGSVQLRLSPPELGAMKIELSVQQGVLTAKLETETAASKSLLLDNLPALRERLAAQEIRVEKFEVDVRQQGSEPDWQAHQKDDGPNRERQPDDPERDSDARGPKAETQTTAQIPSESPDGRLNVVA